MGRCQMGTLSPGAAGCVRSQAEDRGMISKRENESCIQSLGQLHAQQALLGTTPCQAAQLAEGRGQSSCGAS